jgi:hypothetical protein
MTFPPYRSVFVSVDYDLDDLDSQTLQRIRDLFPDRHDTSEVLNALQVALSRLDWHCTNLSKELRATSTFNQYKQTTISKMFDQLKQLLE